MDKAGYNMIIDGSQLSREMIETIKKAIPELAEKDVKFSVLRDYARCKEKIIAFTSDTKYIINGVCKK